MLVFFVGEREEQPERALHPSEQFAAAGGALET
jgi:hypothetical protein